MSATLRIHLQGYADDNSIDKYNNVPVSVDILNDQSETVERRSVIGTTDIDVNPGSYIIRVRLPSGEIVTSSTPVTEGELRDVILRPSHSPHKWAWWVHFLGETGRTDEAPFLASFPGVWLCLWQHNPTRPEGDQWIPLQHSDWLQRKYESENFVLCKIKLAKNGPHFLQLGGSNVPWRFLAVPSTKEVIHVVVRAVRTSTRFRNGLLTVKNGLVVKALTLNQKVEVLSQYLSSGLLEAASIVSEDVLQDAERLLRAKVANPIGAVVGGYYLLQMGASDRMHDWSKNLDNWFPWLPDGAVIHAWWLLSKPARLDSDLALARERLIEAVNRGLGIPVYTQGLRLLIDGLEGFADEARIQQGRDEEVEKALSYLRKYAAAIDWSQPLTTFYGERLTKPSLSKAWIGEQPGIPCYVITSASQKQNVKSKVFNIDEYAERRGYKIFM